ncbi:iron-sulfur cluster binding protein [Deinococcus aerius]|uniref:Iron-sulfur cluster binding protein n=1 Tax=Deinococcus aerius TaxID=200253 RepID=A0A2I9DU11_9DEIO|nr:LutB/LldF family L-lactate oxidation iron-sulfur protein [Deinococcus aerius]GBF06177.1 iron-sulfur cluster binding protein [Deinococcus aerius]
MSAGGIVPRQSFQEAARVTLANAQMRRNLGHATTTIREKRLRAVSELPNWEELRDEGAALKDHVLANLGDYLLDLEASVKRRGGQVHWARDAAEARGIIADIAASHGAREVIKVKSITTDEIELNAGLAERGIHAIETDLAELIVQLAEDRPSHILVPAIHRNRAEIRELFRRKLGAEGLTDEPKQLAEAARLYLREKFLTTKVAVSGANFAVAESGTVCIVESEGNGRMCLTMPEVLISVMGLEKVLPTWQDMAVFLRLLPRSSTAERMNPYTSFWSGVTPGDGPREFHLVLLDNGRTDVLADEVGRQTLRCIRCSACLNVCPVYERAGGHAYGSVYPGPIGAILTPQLLHLEDKNANTLPWASSLCGACYDACPVKINIPEVLLYLRGKITEEKPLSAEAIAFKTAAWVMSEPHRFEGAIKLARMGQGPLVRNGAIHALPGMLGGWTESRDLPPIAAQSFREWWRKRPAPEMRGTDGDAQTSEGEPIAPQREDGVPL